MSDLTDVEKHWEEINKARTAYINAVQKKIQVEPSHLQKLAIEEENMAKEDDMPLEEGQLTEIMGKHKANSPFAVDVAAAQTKLMEVMKE